MKILSSENSPQKTIIQFQEILEHISKERPQFILLTSMNKTDIRLKEIVDLLFKNEKEKALLVLNELESENYCIANYLFLNDYYKHTACEMIMSCFYTIKYCINEDYCDVNKDLILAQGELSSSCLFQLYLEENSIESINMCALDFMCSDNEGKLDRNLSKNKFINIIDKNKSPKIIVTQSNLCKNIFVDLDKIKKYGSYFLANLIVDKEEKVLCHS